MKKFLYIINVNDYMEGNIDAAMDIEKVYKIILNLFRKVPTSHPGEEHRIEFLQMSVIGYDWSRKPPSTV